MRTCYCILLIMTILSCSNNKKYLINPEILNNRNEFFREYYKEKREHGIVFYTIDNSTSFKDSSLASFDFQVLHNGIVFLKFDFDNNSN